MPALKVFEDAREEFNQAGGLIGQMAFTNEVLLYMRAWRNFLAHLDRGFNKMAMANVERGKVSTKIGAIIHLRRTDPLLLYFAKARNVYEHGDADLVAEKPDPVLEAVEASRKHLMHLEGMVIWNGTAVIRDGRTEMLNGETPPWIIPKRTPLPGEKLPHERGSIVLKDFYSVRDQQTYCVPTTHLGRPIVWTDPHDMGGAALMYYSILPSRSLKSFKRLPGPAKPE